MNNGGVAFVPEAKSSLSFSSWVFWLAYAGSTSDMLSGPGRCGADIAHCTQNVAAEAFAWMSW